MARQVCSPGALFELEHDPALAELVEDWDFSPGKRFQAEVLRKFSSSVHHPSSSPDGSFFMLVVFRRYLFRLTEESVAMALHCCLGGSPAGFHVSYLQDRHFRFSVASKHVGLLVRALKRITTDHFDIYFHMWRDGGENWELEHKKWEKEEKDSWSAVIGKNKRKMSAKRVSFHKKLIQDSPVHKSRPRELLSMIKIGAIFCPLTTNSCNVLRKFSISSDYERDVQANSDVLASHKPNGAHCVASSSVVPVQTVFKRLERELDFNGNNFLATNSLQPKHYNEVKLPQGERRRAHLKLKWTAKPSLQPLSSVCSKDGTVQPPPIIQWSLGPKAANAPSAPLPSCCSQKVTLHIPTPRKTNTEEPEQPMPPPPLASANNDQAMANCCASAITEAQLTPAQQLQLMHLIRDYIEIEVRKKVVYFTPHPHGVGFFQLGDPCQRDTLVATSSHWIGGHEVCFVRHDETAINVRNSPYTTKSDDDADPTAHNGSPHSLEGLVVPGDTHLSDEAQDENGILTTLLNPSVGLRDQDPAVTVHAASSSVATAMLRDIDKRVSGGKQPCGAGAYST
ncbi:unnamed protein product [Miscanthus lutarioriparius]|uniref:DUF7597 domain-containing protein n=1 Tax=Miscanthus lutarioriparius TaxID=422564 RepID=A0A811PHK6_9POAL|nr:unnamed protein product [Miscanthus lutarioriparius]